MIVLLVYKNIVNFYFLGNQNTKGNVSIQWYGVAYRGYGAKITTNKH